MRRISRAPCSMRQRQKKICFMRILLLAQKLYADFFQRTSPKKTPPSMQATRSYRCRGSYICRPPIQISHAKSDRDFSAARFKIKFGCGLFGILQLAAQGSQPYAANASALSDRMRKITLKDTRQQLPQFQNRSTRGCKRQAPLFSP